MSTDEHGANETPEERRARIDRYQREADEKFFADQKARRIAAVEAVIPAPILRNGPMPLVPQVETWMRSLIDSGEPGNLLLFGDVGVGKSSQALWALHRAASAGWTGTWAFAYAADLAAGLRGDSNEATVERWSTAGVAIVDDLGATKVTDWYAEQLGRIVQARWTRMLPTVVTTTVGDLQGMLGEWLASRLRDGGTFVELDGNDHRRWRGGAA